MSKPENFYRILGLKKTATEKEIKCRYQSLALRFHPDKAMNLHPEWAAGPAGKAKILEFERCFAAINDAYSVLMDPLMRKEYDKSLQKDSFQESMRVKISIRSQDSITRSWMVCWFLCKAFGFFLIAREIVRFGVGERTARMAWWNTELAILSALTVLLVSLPHDVASGEIRIERGEWLRRVLAGRFPVVWSELIVLWGLWILFLMIKRLG